MSPFVVLVRVCVPDAGVDVILVVAPYLDCKPLPYSVYFECYALCQALARLGGVIRPGLAAEVRQQLVCRRVELATPAVPEWLALQGGEQGPRAGFELVALLGRSCLIAVASAHVATGLRPPFWCTRAPLPSQPDKRGRCLI